MISGFITLFIGYILVLIPNSIEFLGPLSIVVSPIAYVFFLLGYGLLLTHISLTDSEKYIKFARIFFIIVTIYQFTTVIITFLGMILQPWFTTNVTVQNLQTLFWMSYLKSTSIFTLAFSILLSVSWFKSLENNPTFLLNESIVLLGGAILVCLGGIPSLIAGLFYNQSFTFFQISSIISFISIIVLIIGFHLFLCHVLISKMETHRLYFKIMSYIALILGVIGFLFSLLLFVLLSFFKDERGLFYLGFMHYSNLFFLIGLMLVSYFFIVYFKSGEYQISVE